MNKKDDFKNSNAKRSSNSKRKGKRRQQPKADSRDPRVNYDNTRKSKFDRDMDKQYARDAKAADANDISWYSHNPTLMQSAATLPFGYIAGQDLPFGKHYNVPGIMSILWAPAYGGENIRVLNQVKQSMYSYVVHANSRNQSYDPNDLLIVTLAGKDIFTILASMVRAFGMMKTFAERNRYMPKAMLTACGFDYDDLVENYSKMWFDLNEMIARSTQIWLPNNIPLVTRQFWLNTNVYVDSTSVKGQMYVFVQERFMKYYETAFNTGGCLATVQGPDGTNFTPGRQTYTWEQWKSVFNDMISALLESQDRGIMYGDILKAYGKENIFMMNEIQSDYTVTPVYNAEVLTQIENATVWGVTSQTASGLGAETIKAPYGLYQDGAGQLLPYYYGTGYTKGADMTTAIAECAQSKVVLNLHGIETPTQEQVMIATRLQSIGTDYTKVALINSKPVEDPTTPLTVSQGYRAIPRTCGTELVTAAAFWAFSYNTDVLVPTAFGSTNASAIAPFGNSVLNAWAAFDWAPWWYTHATVNYADSQATTGLTNAAPAPEQAVGDYDQYTILTYEDLLKLHTTAVYSLFGVPVL